VHSFAATSDARFRLLLHYEAFASVRADYGFSRSPRSLARHPRGMADKDVLGARGEELAAAALAAAGYLVLDRNWRCQHGEIDIVAVDGDETVFVEVKTRSSIAFGHPLEAITAQKLARLRRLAAAWCEAHPGHHDRIRIDAIAIVAPAVGQPQIEHLRRVF
jgi:putative endonuclease